MKKRVCLILAVIMIFSLLLSGCGSSGSYTPSSSSSASYAMADSADSSRLELSGMGKADTSSWGKGFGGTNNKSSSGSVAANEIRELIDESNNEGNENGNNENENHENFDERKIVYSADITAQTKDLNAAKETIAELMEETGAYIEKQSVRNNGDIYQRYQTNVADYTIRVPSKNFYVFIDGLSGDNIYINSMNQDSTDYSEQYYDSESRINSLRTQETRLLELIENAHDTKTILEIEDRLSQIRYEIENLTKTLRFIDAHVDYSIITISITEVIKYTEPEPEPTNFVEEFMDVAEKSVDDFLEWGKGVLFGLIYAGPYIIIVLVIILIVLACVRSSKKKKMREAEKAAKLRAATEVHAPIVKYDIHTEPVTAPQETSETKDNEGFEESKE